MIDLSTGSLVNYQGERYRIVRPYDLEIVLVEAVDTGRLRELPIHALTPGDTEPDTHLTLGELSPEDKETAEYRYALIQPLLSLNPRPRKAVEARARETGTSPATLYRYLSLFERGGHISVLGRRGRSDAGQSRQSPEILALMDAVIQDKYLKRQQHSVTHTYQELKLRCHKLGLKPPSLNTLSRRIQKIAPQERMRRRRGASEAEKLRPLRGALPGANAPWDIIQIDHTQLDLILVTEDGREVAQRPYITVAIDSYSRVVLGYHVSRDAPSYFSAGACLTHAMLPKDDYLAGHQKRLSDLLEDTLKDHREVQETMTTLRWPVWGRPTKLLVDNAREFRGKMLERSCQEYGIHVELRPVKKPWYGGHIERLMGTVASELHNIPETTFSNPRRRGDYDSSGKAVMTFEELDLWLTIFFAGVYNQRPHRGLNGQIPLDVYRRGLLEGTKNPPPKGLFPLPSRDQSSKMQIDFLPSFEVTIQRTGITLDTVRYYHEVLEPYLARREVGKPSERFIVRRDPRNISHLYFYAEDLGRYFAIPYSNPTWGQISIWELRALKARVRPGPGKHTREDDLLRELAAMRHVVHRAEKATREAKRTKERKRAHAKVEPYLNVEPTRPSPALEPEDDDVVITPLKVHR